MAAFPNLTRELRGRIIDLGNLSYMCHEGATHLSHDVMCLYDCTMREFNRRLAIRHENARQALEDDEGLPDGPSEAALALCASYAALSSDARLTHLSFQGMIDDHQAFFEANRSSLIESTPLPFTPRDLW
jgi:hypothetical protein